MARTGLAAIRGDHWILGGLGPLLAGLFACGSAEDSRCDATTTPVLTSAPLGPADLDVLTGGSGWSERVEAWHAQADGAGGLWLASDVSGPRHSVWLDARGAVRRGPELAADEICVVAGVDRLLCASPAQTRLVERDRTLTSTAVRGTRPFVSGSRLGLLTDTELVWLESTTSALVVGSRVRLDRAPQSIQPDGAGGAWIVDDGVHPRRLAADGTLQTVACGEGGVVETWPGVDDTALAWGISRDGHWLARCDVARGSLWSARLRVPLDAPVGGGGGLLTTTADEALILVADGEEHLLLRYALADGAFATARIADPLGPSGLSFGRDPLRFSGAVATVGHDDATFSILYGDPSGVGVVVRYEVSGARQGEPVRLTSLVHPAIPGDLVGHEGAVWALGETFVQRVSRSGAPLYHRGRSACTETDHLFTMQDDGTLSLLGESP
ncbi:MAG: hypothetical protein J0L92_14445 [Deltaproteobacteria bacterium]|nr:hypothetical protein [Deltaproteobacteria bacterium]